MLGRVYGEVHLAQLIDPFQGSSAPNRGRGGKSFRSIKAGSMKTGLHSSCRGSCSGTRKTSWPCRNHPNRSPPQDLQPAQSCRRTVKCNAMQARFTHCTTEPCVGLSNDITCIVSSKSPLQERPLKVVLRMCAKPISTYLMSSEACSLGNQGLDGVCRAA